MATGTIMRPTNSVSFTVTLTTTWNNNTQIVSNSNFVTNGYSYIVTPSSDSFTEYANCKIYAKDIGTNDTPGQMTFYCSSVPSNALTVNIVRVVS